MASFTGETMTNHRRSALLAGLTALVCAISLACGGSPACPRSTAPAAAIVVKAAGAGSRPATRSSGTAPTSATPTASARDRHPEPGGAARSTAPGASTRRRGGSSRQDLHDHLVLQRPGRPQRAGRGCEARHHRADPCRSGDQQRENYKPWKSLKQAISRLKRNFSNPDPNNIARECSGSCRGGGGTTLQVLPLRRRGQLARPQHRDADLDEPDPVRLQGPVEPGDRVPGRKQFFNLFRLIHNQMAERTTQRQQCLRAPGCRGRDQHLLPGGQRLARPRHADAVPGALQGRPSAAPTAGPGSGSSSTPSTRPAATASPRGCATCGTPAATCGSSTGSPAGRC